LGRGQRRRRRRRRNGQYLPGEQPAMSAVGGAVTPTSASRRMSSRRVKSPSI
jgi:hypothetical protein